MNINEFGFSVSAGLVQNQDPKPADSGESRMIAGEALWMDYSGNSAGVTVTERTALQFPGLLAVINVLASDVALLPLRAMRRTPTGGREVATGHPVHKIFNWSPNGGESTPLKWKQALVTHAAVWGNGLAEIVRTGRGQATALHLLDPELTKTERDESGALFYLIRGPGGRRIPAANVFHLAGLGWDGLNGWNFVRLIKQAIGVGMASEGYAADFFANGSDVDGVIEMPGTLGNDQARENFRKSWEMRHRGPGKRHGTAVLEAGARFNQMDRDAAKTQLVETRRFQVQDVARPWRVPPHKFGDFSESHLSNIEASNIDYLTTALMPWLVGLEQEANLKLLTPAEFEAGYHFEHDVAALLRGDSVSRYESYSKALTLGWMSRDEVRHAEGMNPIGEAGGGDKYLTQFNQTTLDKIGETAGTGVPPAPPVSPTNQEQEQESQA